ncbi:MAG: signal peptidase I [Deltaproteobacteria bacterium]|nr:signal peptidase I [Deltaproteobacteria bacterium]
MRKTIKALLWIVGIAVLVGVVLRGVVIATWTVPDDPWLSVSVAPTLRGGDLVLMLTRGSPGFGDLVRCSDPDNPGGFVVGRIVAEEGDAIEMAGGILRIGGTRYDATESCTKTRFTVQHPDTGSEIEMRCSRVEMGGSWHFRGNLAKPRTQENFQRTVDRDRVFLLSDNRDMHQDSRDFGPLLKSTCKERIFFRLWSKAGFTETESRMTYIR